MSKKKVVILGGSFNPVHLTHSYILEQAHQKLNTDEKYYLINNIPPHKQMHGISNEHRLNMLKLQANLDGSNIIDYELHQDEISYTYYTIKYLFENNPSWDIYFLIGQDNINILNSWYKYEKLKNMVTFVGVKRGNVDANTSEDILMLELDVVSDVSSTKIRTSSFDNISNDVKTYIKTHNLYK